MHLIYIQICFQKRKRNWIIEYANISGYLKASMNFLLVRKKLY